MLLGWSDLLHVNGACKLVQREQNTMQQIALSALHSFLDRDTVFSRVIFPTPQNFDLLLL